MKHILLLALGLIFSLGIFAQNAKLVVISKIDKSFIIRLNGEKQNAEPQKKVKVIDLEEKAYQAVIIFKNAKNSKKKFKIRSTFYPKNGFKQIYKIKQKDNGKYVVSLTDEIPLNNNNGNENENPTANENKNVTLWNNPDNGVSINISIPNDSIANIVSHKVKVNERKVDNVVITTVTTTITTFSATSIKEEVYIPTYENTEDEEIVEEVCSFPDDEYNAAKRSIKRKNYSSGKLTTAKQITKANCLTTIQVKGFVSLFNFENDRLEYAKFAYDYVSDKNKYYLVNDAFTFESTIEELNDYILNK